MLNKEEEVCLLFNLLFDIVAAAILKIGSAASSNTNPQHFEIVALLSCKHAPQYLTPYSFVYLRYFPISTIFNSVKKASKSQSMSMKEDVVVRKPHSKFVKLKRMFD